MVARPNEPERSLATRLRGVFAWWRRALDSLVRSAVHVATTSRPLAAGVTALLVGAAGSALLATRASGALAGVVAASTLLVWAGIRLLVLNLAAHATYRTSRHLLTTAWGWSLLPFALAVTDVLHALAVALSALVAWRVLEHLGVTRREAALLVAWSWGFQVATVLAVWLARNVVLAARIILAG